MKFIVCYVITLAVAFLSGWYWFNIWLLVATILLTITTIGMLLSEWGAE